MAAVTILRSNGGHVTAQDLRFPFRAVKDFDAQERLRHRSVHELNRKWGNQWGNQRTVIEAESELAALDDLSGDSRLRRVAGLYEDARSVGKSTGQHIADEMFVSQNHARQLISRARKKGFIPSISTLERKAD